MPAISHPWDLSPSEAVALQKQLAAQVIRENRLGPVKTVAGVDASYRDGLAGAAVVVLSYPELEPLEQVYRRTGSSENRASMGCSSRPVRSSRGA